MSIMIQGRGQQKPVDYFSIYILQELLLGDIFHYNMINLSWKKVYAIENILHIMY